LCSTYRTGPLKTATVTVEPSPVRIRVTVTRGTGGGAGGAVLRGAVTRVTTGAPSLPVAWAADACAAARVWGIRAGAELQAAIVTITASAPAIGSRCFVLLTCMRCLTSRGVLGEQAAGSPHTARRGTSEVIRADEGQMKRTGAAGQARDQ
jgi:hypothetical protein